MVVSGTYSSWYLRHSKQISADLCSSMSRSDCSPTLMEFVSRIVP